MRCGAIPKCSLNNSIMAMARAAESSQLLRKRAVWMGIESVCPEEKPHHIWSCADALRDFIDAGVSLG